MRRKGLWCKVRLEILSHALLHVKANHISRGLGNLEDRQAGFQIVFGLEYPSTHQLVNLGIHGIGTPSRATV